MINLLLILVLSYLMGSIPFGFLLGKFFLRLDLREHGSGNVGATNALRVLGWKWGLLAFLLDMSKGLGAVILAKSLLPDNNLVLILAGLASILGHIFTIFLRFKGGKGVATSAGVFAALIPVSLAIALGCFIIVTVLSRYVSAGSISASLTLVIAQSYFTFRNGLQNPEYLVLAVIVAGFVIIKHRSNIQRLIKGTENKISFKKKEQSA